MVRENHQEQGSIIVSILIITLFLTSFIFGLVVLASSNLARTRGRLLLLEAQYAAESGGDAAIAILNSGNDTYTGTSSDVQVLSHTQYKATYAVTVANGSTAKERIITAVGKVYAPATATTPSFVRNIEVTAQRT